MAVASNVAGGKESRGRWRRRLLVGGLALAGTLVAFGLEAGGTIGWADGVGEFAAEGAAVGQAAVTLGVVILGLIIGFHLQSMVPVVVAAIAGFVIAANGEAIASIFGGGAAGGSILDATVRAGALAAGLPH